MTLNNALRERKRERECVCVKERENERKRTKEKKGERKGQEKGLEQRREACTHSQVQRPVRISSRERAEGRPKDGVQELSSPEGVTERGI